MITALILIPLIGALLVAVLPRAVSRTATLAIITAAAAVVAYIMLFFNTGLGGLQLVEMATWVPSIGADYLVAVDGLSLLLVLLTTLVVPFGLIASKNPTRGFCSLMLLTMGALYGTFTAHNFILWFLFYEMSLIPAFLLIKLWGGEKRDAAATQFFVFTFLGSVAMLVAMLGVYHTAGTFNFHEFGPIGQNGLLTGTAGWLMFTGVCLGIAVKVPVFPFHTWLPDAYTAAPTGVSMVLTGILSKMGVYAALRLLLPLFPQQIQAAQPILLTLVVLSIVLSTLAALAQQDLKRMVAYISINHLGYCMLAIVAIGSTVAVAPGARVAFAPDVQAALGGVFMQIFNHGITAAALFYWAGLLEERRGSRLLGDYGGLMQQTPQLCAWMSLAMFSSLGLPGLNGFIGEILIFKGAFNLAPVATACAGFGLLITAGVFLRAMQKLFSGPLADSCKSFPNLTLQEKLIVIPVSILMLALGIAPGFMFNIFNSTVTQMANLFS
jgi:NADH-quinone oxidoreductase subunit M